MVAAYPRYTPGVINAARHYLPWLFAALLVILCLASSIRQSVEQLRAGVAIPFGSIAYNERRMQLVKPSLPARGIIGYVTDLDMTRDEGSGAWFAAGYSLAPLVLSPAPGLQMVLGNFGNPANAPAIAQREGLTIVRDFGRGLILFQRAGK
jgi:hypothetical protein